MRRKPTILTINDNKGLGSFLKKNLKPDNFFVFACSSYSQCVRMCGSRPPDLVIIRHHLADHDSREFVRLIRKDCHSPIIIITDHPSDDELIDFLNIGANDYLGTTINADVIVAKVQAIIRTETIRQFGAPLLLNGVLRMDLVRHEVFVEKKLVGFTPKEFELLRFFLLHKGQMLFHRDILRAVWGFAHGGDVAYLRVYIGQVRKKIDLQGERVSMITSENGIGYRMEVIEPKRLAGPGEISISGRSQIIADTSFETAHS